jgi:signal-transduction protein with cAMP-binding, CBS, and nucleotidyltransferase domain
LITDNYSLAEQEITTSYQAICEYIEVWDRSIVYSLPYEVLEKLNYSESNLEPFYEHVELKTNELKKIIKQPLPLNQRFFKKRI